MLFSSIGGAGGGGAMRRIVTEGAAAVVARYARGMFSDRGFGIGVPAREGEDAAVHLEWGCGASAAEVGGRFG